LFIFHAADGIRDFHVTGVQTCALPISYAGAWIYPPEQLEEMGLHCSMTERRADDATRQVDEWLKCEFMQDHIGEEFGGVIAAVKIGRASGRESAEPADGA